jgi:hypothetical protein
MQFVLVIYHGTYPLPGTPGWGRSPRRSGLGSIDPVHKVWD